MTSHNLYIAYGVTIALHVFYGMALFFRHRRVRMRAAQLWPHKG